ncbi:MAG TPA: alanine--tRNA ligase [Methanocellales archaeon]|nr:alanine--tRNA ligase [Methanocellales archaeon]
MNDKELKKKMKSQFFNNYEKFYPVKALGSLGFSRSVCKRCGSGFWSMNPRDFCDEPACSGGYRFIDQSLTKKLGYREAWDVYVDTFEKWGYIPLDRYPVVCRWYDQLYFVTAGINDFQPYVVSGEVAPPADAILEPQFCLRFPDIDSVGITGRHYTGFIMVGQHVFNTPKKFIYFKEEGITQIHEFLTKGLGIPSEELFFQEEVWAGGGNFGPCIEFFSRGLELGNQVYIQYQLLPDGDYRELSTKVIDMGAGLERWSWFTQGTPMSYDTVFPKVMRYLYEKTDIVPDKVLWNKFARYAGLLNMEEIDDVSSTWNAVAKQVGIEPSTLKGEIYQVRALYALADHTRTLLVAIHDGALPSNVGGGYNLRNILRRCWSLIDEYGLDVELEQLFKLHITEFGAWFTELKEYGSLFDILETEKKRYDETLRKDRELVKRMIGRKEKFDIDKLVKLYDSQGITPNILKEFDPSIVIPDDFYLRVQMLHEKSEQKREISGHDIERIPQTKLLFREEPDSREFKAEVLHRITPTKIVLDQTLFYPTSGGQAHDTGTINGAKVLDVIKDNGVVIHVLEKPIQGDQVHGIIDWEVRKALSEHHTATHIVNYAARKVLGDHIWQAGAEKTLEKARLDITHYKSLSFEQIQEIEKVANDVVMEDVPILVKEMPRNEAESKHGMGIYQGGAVPGKRLRIVAIGKYDVEACGGTYVKSTSQVGLIKIINSERIQDGVVRLEYVSGERAIKEIQRQASILRELSDLWAVSPDDISKTANKFFREWKELQKEKARLKEELAKSRESDLIDKNVELVGDLRIVSKILPDADAEELREVASHLTEKHPDIVVILGTSDSNRAYICDASGNYAIERGINAAPLIREMCKEVGGSGGGTSRLAQGGGPDVEKLDKAMKKGLELVKKQLR